MSSTITRTRFATLLIATTIATYVLIVLGTAVSTTGSAGSCTTWPSCSSGWSLGPVTGDGLLFWGHRAAALSTGILLAGAAVMARRLEIDRLTRGGLALACFLFPVQVGVGALLVVRESAIIGATHLLLAMGIFAGLLVALVRTLELTVETGDADDAATPDIGGEPGGDVQIDDPATDEPVPAADGGSEPASSPQPAPVTTSGGRLTELRRTVGAYITLTKPKLMWLLCLVALAGIGLATLTGAALEPSVVVATLVGGVLAIGASGTFNHVHERDRDRKMERTADRPLVHDRVPVLNAVVFGVALTVTSAAVMLVWVNLFATLLTLAAIGYYVVLYTVLLKPNTAWNTVLGGGAGAIPALIGWVAVTGSVGLPAVVLAAVIFLWTPAHFYSLAIAYREDYAKGGFPMFPVVRGDLVARRHIMLFLGATLLSVSLLGWVAGLGWIYALTSVALGAVFLRSVTRQYRTPTKAVALESFYVSNYYLGAILVAIIVETLVAA